MRLMQRCERDEFFQRREDARIQAYGLRVFEPSVENAVAGAHQDSAGKRLAQIRQQMIESAV